MKRTKTKPRTISICKKPIAINTKKRGELRLGYSP
jgi:hypothetical protein